MNWDKSYILFPLFLTVVGEHVIQNWHTLSLWKTLEEWVSHQETRRGKSPSSVMVLSFFFQLEQKIH